MDRIGCAGLYAFSAPDTFRMIGRLPCTDIHFAYLPAFSTSDAGLCIDLVTEYCEGIKKAVKCPKRAQIFTEGPKNPYRQQRHSQQHQNFPAKQHTGRFPQTLCHSHQRNSRKQGTTGADILTEPGLPLALDTCCQKGKQYHEQCQNQIFPFCQEPMSRKIFPFFHKWNLIQQILDQSKRAQPPAYSSSKYRSKQQQKSYYIERKTLLSSRQRRLQRTNGTGAQGSWAGIAVQARHAGLLQRSCIDASCDEAIEISIGQRRKSSLNPQSYPTTQFQYTPDIYKFL